MVLARIKKQLLLALIASLLASCGGGKTELDGNNPMETDGEVTENTGGNNQTPPETEQPDPDNGNSNPDNETPAANNGDSAINLYAEQCVDCHGVNGRGGATGGELHNCDVCGSEPALYDTILETMPLTDAQMCDSDCSQKLAHYIFNNFDNTAGGITDPPLPAPTATPTTAPTTTPPPMPTPTAIPTVAPGLEGFVFCSEESSRPWAGEAGLVMCEFTGTREVAFGANGQYNFLTATESIECSFEIFGDPLPGVGKACYISAPIEPTPTPMPTPSPTATPTPVLPGADICDQLKPTALSENFFQNANTPCAACHGTNGSGGIGPNLNNISFDSVEAFESVVRTGPGVMPAYSTSEYPSSAALNDFAYFAHDALCGTVEEPPEENASCEQREDLLAPKLRRLTKAQFTNTVTSVFGNIFSDVSWPEFNDGIPTVGMSNNADILNINTINIESVYGSISAIIDTVIMQDSTIANCANSGNSACLTTLLDNYGPLLWRRPLNNIERQDILDSLSDVRDQGVNNAGQVKFLFKTLMLSSNFLYRSELGVAQDNVSRLTAYEVASLMSYSLWDSPPDAALYGLAASDDLLTQSVVDQQVERMINDNRFDRAMAGFYIDLLKLERIKSVEKFPSLNFSPTVREALLQSAKQSLESRVADSDRDILEVLNSDSFYVNNSIAYLFGLNNANFGSSMTATTVTAGERNGLLTHPAFLGVHSKEGGSGIVKRGVFVLKQLMCVDLGQPPDELTEVPLPPEVDPATTSTRDLLYITHTSQPLCNGCHSVIDPAGFGFENYDSVGQFRMFEKEVVPIDSSGTIENVASAPIVFNDHIEYTDYLMSAPVVRACVTRRLLESFAGQHIDKESCELEKLQANVSEDTASIRDLVTGLMRLESLRIRSQ